MIRRVQPNVFDVQDELMNMPVDCDQLDGIDLENWREKSEALGREQAQIFVNLFQPIAK